MYQGIRVCFCFLASLLVSVSCFAQIDNSSRGRLAPMVDEGEEEGVIRGQIYMGNVVAGQLYVIVKKPGMDSYDQRVSVSGDGTFMFSGSNNATYLLRIVDNAGNVLDEELVTPNTMGYVEIQLRERKDARPVNGTVSAFELNHKVPSKAYKEARAADKSLQKKDTDAYLAHLEKAVEIDPDYLLARRNLGIMYLRTGQLQKSIDEFQEVTKRDSRSLTAYAGISSAYLQLEKFKDAEEAARRALSVDPGSDVSHYFLGVSLELQGKDDTEALEHLERVQTRFPRAHLVAAEILQRMGKKKEAKSQLQAYLASGDKGVTTDVKGWLSSLN